MSRTVEASRTRWKLWTLVCAVALAVGAGVGWATAYVLSPAQDVLASDSFTYVKAENGEVGSTIRLNTTATWSLEATGTNQAAGIVTGVLISPGDQVAQGGALYSVNMRPVSVAAGVVPAFRAIALDDEGQDVAQLQVMLGALGFYAGAGDGKAGPQTIAGVRAWQKSLGLKTTGIVELGDVIFVPNLPARLSLDTTVLKRGASLSGGEEVVRTLPSSPVFTVPVTESQSRMMPAGTRVDINAAEDAQWTAYVTDRSVDAATGAVTLNLQGLDGASICLEQCAAVPVAGDNQLPSEVVIVDKTKGLVVPSAALITDAQGAIAVVDSKGKHRQVTVVTSARGMSVIEGIPQGTRVRMPATEAE